MISILKGQSNQIGEDRLDYVFRNIAASPYKDDIAILFEDSEQLRKQSFSEVERRANKLARSIQLMLLKKGNSARNSDGDCIIAVKMHPSDYLLIVLLAIWKIGAAYLPLDDDFPKSRVDYIITDAKPMMIIFDEGSDFKEGILALSFTELLNFSETQSGNILERNEMICGTQCDIAVVLYTSGSTGTPKGVRIPHRAILNRLEWQYKQFPYEDNERTCVFKTALTFSDSIAEIWGPLLQHRSILVVPRKYTQNPEKFLNILDKYKVQRLVLVPSLMETLLLHINSQMNKTQLNQLKLWVCSGETLDKLMVKKFYECFPKNEYKICNFYGSTEITADVTYYVITGVEDVANYDKVPIGEPIFNTRIYLLDKDLRPVEAGQQGEIFVSGLSVAEGYVNGSDPDKRFSDNPLDSDPIYSKLFRTGDFGRIVDGTLFYEGRIDSQVKIGGRRVDLAEIEKALTTLDEVEKAVVLYYKPQKANQTILAFAVVNDHRKKGLHIEAVLKNLLMWYMIPEVVIVEEIPLLVSGKVDRQALVTLYEAMANDEVPMSYEGVGLDQLKEAEVLFETIESALGNRSRSMISVDANFYEIGGNSLNTICIISTLMEKGYNISIDDFLRANNIGEILKKMNSASQHSREPDEKEDFTTEPLENKHKKIVTEMIIRSFHQKSHLLGFLENLSESDYEKLVNAKWNGILEANLSFVIKSRSNGIVGVCINHDSRIDPVIEIDSEITVVGEFMEFLEGPIRDNELPPGIGTVLYSSVATTHWSLSHQENIAAMLFMEEEVLDLAKKRGFVGVFTTNTSQLTQQLGRDILKYRVMLDYQVNQYVDRNGTRPFAGAPDSQRAIVSWKEV